jgi:hypothetical protein
VPVGSLRQFSIMRTEASPRDAATHPLPPRGRDQAGEAISLRGLLGTGSASTLLRRDRAESAGRVHDSVLFMRKQYHLWPAGAGFDAWDVDRLIHLSRGLPVHAVMVDSVREVDTVYWFDASTAAPTVRAVVEHARMMLDADLSVPVILGPDGRVMDGMHRIARVMLEGMKEVSAIRFLTLPEPDYRDCQPADLPY